MPQMKSRLFFGITIALVLMVNQPVESTSKICDSQKCVQQAARIIDYVDPNANPCEDFYQFACGNFLKNVHGNEKLSLRQKLFDQYEHEVIEIYAEDIRVDDHKMVKAAKRLYQSCVDEYRIARDGVEIINKTLQTLGGWPVVEGSNWAEESFDWLNTTYKLRRLGYFYQAFLHLSVGNNFEGLELHSSYRFAVPQLNVMAKMAALFGAENKENTLKELTDVQKFSEVLRNLRNRGQYDHHYKKYTVEEMQEKEGGIDWLEFINNIAGPNVQISKHDYVVYAVGSLKQMINLLSETPKRVQANYMVVKMLEPILPFLSYEYDSVGWSLKRRGRFEFCLDELFDRSIIPIDIIRDRKYLPEEKRKTVEKFVLNLTSTFLDVVNKIEWVQEETKQAVISKLGELKIIVGYPGNYFDDEIFDMIDADMMDVEDNATFFSLLAQATRNHESRIYKLSYSENLYRILCRISRSTPAYTSLYNVLYIPSTATREFVFDQNWTEYLNYGTFGEMVLYSLSDAFFSSRVRHSLSDVFFWPRVSDTEEQDNFNTKRQCWARGMKIVLDDYNYREVEDVMTSSIAEKIAYTAYEEWAKNNGEDQKLIAIDYSPNQLFWISSAIPRCQPVEYQDARVGLIKMAPYMVTESMRYNPNFSKDFNCPANSTMNPSERCEIL